MLRPFAKLLIRLALFSLPLLIVFGYLEWRLCSIPSRFTHKREVLLTRGPMANVLVLGNSHGNSGLDPALFPCPGINLANDSQTLDIDAEILTRHIARLERLQVVILPVAFFSLYLRLRDVPASHWRLGAYQRLLELDVGEFLSVSQWLQDSYVGRYTPRGALALALQGFPVGPRDSTELGWTPKPPEVGKTSPKEGQWRADRHRASKTTVHKEELVRALVTMLSLAKAVGATPVVLVPPFHANYLKAWPRADLQEFRLTVEGIVHAHGAVLVDYSMDGRLQDEDFADADHLSPRGAIRFSRIVSDEVLSPLLHCDDLAPMPLAP
jgi:hypothetical protein